LLAALATALGIGWAPGIAQAATVLHYDFNETGNAPGSTGTDTRPVKLLDDGGNALDFHSADAGGVSGLPGDRSFANTGPSDQGRFADGATNGFRAEQSDNPAVDGLSAFTLSGWFRTELADTFLPNATPRLVNNHDDGAGSAGDGFNLQFLTGSEGDLKLEVDDDTGGGVNTTGALYSGKQKWVFFAVSYDGSATIDNVNFYIGFRDDAEAGGGPGSAAVALVTTASLDRGPVDGESVGLRLANRFGDDRPFKGFLDEIRIDDVAHAGPGGLAILETYRQMALAPPLDVELRHVDAWTLDSSAFGVVELSGITYDPDTERFWAVSDDGGRLLEIDVEFDASGAIVTAAAVSAATLDDTLDFEAIAYTDSVRNSVFVSEENSPGVREYDLATGVLLQTLSVPSVFGDNLRFNLGFESLARNAHGSEMLTGVEQALTVDGPAGTSPTIGTVSRWLRYAVAGNIATPAEHFAYRAEPAHDTPVSSSGSGLSELAVLPNGALLALERSEAAGESLVRVFLATTENATDVSQGDLGSGLIGEIYVPVAKTLLFSNDGLGKVEGLALGPVLANGDIVLLSVEDVGGTSSIIRSFVLSGDFDPPSTTPTPVLTLWGRGLLMLTLAALALLLSRSTASRPLRHRSG
jgi:hypothetical protein